MRVVEWCHRVLAGLLSVGFVAGAIDAIARNETPVDREFRTICFRVAAFALFSIPLFIRAAGKNASWFARRLDPEVQHRHRLLGDGVFWTIYATIANAFATRSTTTAGWAVSSIALALAACAVAITIVQSIRRAFDDDRRQSMNQDSITRRREAP
jgi:hypothetical protein